MENPKIKPEIAPFKKLCMSIGAIPTSFQDSMDYYECVLWLIKYLENTIIPVVNNNGEAVAELQELYITLKNYVENYFENLDVQDEINNKLDEMAEDGELENIIALYINKEVQFIFPKFWEDQYSQDVSIIKGYDKNILIDCGSSTNWSNILLMISSHQITHFDYFIISHYDADHIGNISNLIIQGLIDENTHVYLPVVPDNFPTSQATETSVKTTLTTNDISYETPTENQILSINNDFDIRFGNLNKSYMESNYTQYNATSMVCLVRHKQTTAFFSGDAFSQTFKYLYDTNFIKTPIHLYKQPHHGIDNENPWTLFDRTITPKMTVQLGGINDFIKNNFLCEETSYLINQGTLYFPCYMNNDYVKFSSTGHVINNISGKTFDPSGQRIKNNIYVDINADTDVIQDGTEAHPFTELMQAIGYIQNLGNGEYNIYLADGDYGYSHEANAQKNKIILAPNNNVYIVINGNSGDRTAVQLHDTLIYNCNVKFNNLTIDLTDSDGIVSFNSNIFLNNVKITSPANSQSGHTGIILNSNSNLYAKTIEISYGNYGIRTKEGSRCFLDGITASNITYYTCNNEHGYITPRDLISSDQTTSPIQLSDDIRQFKRIVIKYKSSDNIYNSIEIPAPAYTTKFTLKVPYVNTSNITYDKQAIAQLISGNKLEIQQAHQTYINAQGTISTTDINNPFTIEKVIGYYE